MEPITILGTLGLLGILGAGVPTELWLRNVYNPANLNLGRRFSGRLPGSGVQSTPTPLSYRVGRNAEGHSAILVNVPIRESQDTGDETAPLGHLSVLWDQDLGRNRILMVAQATDAVIDPMAHTSCVTRAIIDMDDDGRLPRELWDGVAGSTLPGYVVRNYADADGSWWILGFLESDAIPFHEPDHVPLSRGDPRNLVHMMDVTSGGGNLGRVITPRMVERGTLPRLVMDENIRSRLSLEMNILQGGTTTAEYPPRRINTMIMSFSNNATSVDMGLEARARVEVPPDVVEMPVQIVHIAQLAPQTLAIVHQGSSVHIEQLESQTQVPPQG